MKVSLFLITASLMLLLILVLTACGGNTSTASVQPGPNAPTISPDVYLTSYAESDHVLLDVRTPQEVAGGVISGAINIPLQELQSRVSELPQDKTIVVYCNSGNRSRSAASILRNAGYTNLLDLGGVVQWRRAGQSLVPLQ